jgi:hypothetical protein
MEHCQERIRNRDITLHVDSSNPEQKISGKYVKLFQIIAES